MVISNRGRGVVVIISWSWVIVVVLIVQRGWNVVRQDGIVVVNEVVEAVVDYGRRGEGRQVRYVTKVLALQKRGKRR